MSDAPNDILAELKRRVRQLQAEEAEKADARWDDFYRPGIERRRLRQARRQATRTATRYEVWLRLDSLLQLYEALRLNPVFGSPTGDGLPVYQWRSHSSLPPELYDKREAEWEAAGGVQEVRRLFRRLDVLARREPTLEQLFKAIFGGKAEELGDGKSSIWPDGGNAKCSPQQL